MHIFLHSLPLFQVSLHYKLSALQVELSEKNKLNYTAVRNCKNVRLRVKTGLKQNTLINASEQFTTTK